jgi:zinc protease
VRGADVVSRSAVPLAHSAPVRYTTAMSCRGTTGGSGSRCCSLVVGCCVLASAACLGQMPPAVPTAEVGEYPTSEVVLANGLRVVLEQGPDIGVAGAVLVVGVGAANEAPGKAGLAHLTEHLFFETREEGELPLRERLRARAAIWNGGTSWDTTTYTAFGPVPALEGTLALLADALAQPLAGVSEADFQHELEIVQNERRLRSENGTHSEALGFLTAAVFPESFPYAHPVAGTRESLNGLVLGDVRNFVRAGYAPERATLSISSPLELGEQRRLIERAFGSPAQDPSGAPAPRAVGGGASPPLRAAGTAPETHDALVANPTVLIGWPVPSSLTQRGCIPELLARMARGTFFYDSELRDVADGSAGYLEGSQGDLFYVTLTLEPSNDDAKLDIQDLIHRASSRLRRGLYEYTSVLDLFERYKRLTATSYTYSLESIGTRATWLAFSQHFLSSHGVLAARDRQLLSLQESEVNAYIETYLSEARARAVLLHPAALESVAPSVRRGTPSAQAQVVPEPSTLPATPPEELQSWLRRPNPEELRTGTLSNGMRVIVANRPDSVYHTVLVGFAGGETAEDAPGVSIAEPWSLWSVLYEPSAQGLTVEREHTVDSSVELLRSTGANVALTLSALRDRLDGVNISWPPRTFLDRLKSYAREDAQPANRLAREVSEALFGGDVYGRRATSEQIGAVQPNDIQRFRANLLRPENGVLVIVGNVPPERGLALAEELMGGWGKWAERRPAVPAPKPVAAGAPQRIERDWPRANRAQLGLDCLLDASSSERAAVATMLGRLIQQRLYEQLRQQLGASYSVADRTRLLRGGTALLEFVADAGYAHFVLADAMVDAFVRGSSTSFSEAELADARRQFAAQYGYALSTTDVLARSLFSSWVLGYSVAEFVALPDQYLGVTLQQINAAAQQCAQHAVVSLLGDLTQIQSARQRSRP